MLEELLPDGAAFVGQSGLNGRVVVSPQELASVLDSLIEDGNARAALGKGAYNASASCLWPVVTERFCQAYGHAMEK